MREFSPLLFAGALVGVFATAFLLTYLRVRGKKEELGFEREMSDREIVRRLMAYARPYRGRFVLVLLIMLVSIGYDLIGPLIVGRIEEMISGQIVLPRLFAAVAVYAGILAVSMLCTYLQTMLLQKTGQKILSAMREELFTHIESLSHAQLSRLPVGKLVTRVANDTNAISTMFTNILVNMIKNVFVIVGVFTAMLLLNYALTLMVLCFVPFVVLFTVIFRKFSRRAHRRVKDGTTEINTFLSENLSGMKVIQVFGREEKKREAFEQRNERLKRAEQGMVLVGAIFRPTVYMLYILSVLCLLYLGARGVIREVTFLGQVMTGGTIVSFYLYISKFFDPVQSLAEQFNNLQSAFASAEKIFSVLDLQPDVVDEPDAIELAEVRGDIEFKNVWFAYEGEQWVLRDVSFHVLPRQTAAFVGSTGSGKSTILSLLCRNYDIARGQILVDGIDIRHVKIASLRRHFGQMLQDVFLFSGTIRSNIALREDRFTDEQIMAACRYVNADRFIDRLDGGLDEPVRERGNNFSAGQRQLISFARTILHEPSVMILDEATANIDTETELLIQDSLDRMRSIGTMLIVAHRLSTIQHADQIFVLSHGQIEEHGTHQELLHRRGRYHQLYTLQFDKKTAAAVEPPHIPSGSAEKI